MFERTGIEIDYCPQCRGVWLDRGELDKIIERSTTATPSVVGTSGRLPDRERGDRDHDHDRRDGEHGGRKKGKESWLTDLFG